MFSIIKLDTDRLILRDYVENDISDLHKLLSDNKNMYYLDDIASSSIEDSHQNLESAMANADGHYFCIRSKETDEFIGSVGYTITDITPVGKMVHMGYFILPEHHGLGYTTEAVKRALIFAFTCDGCIRVTTGCYKDNRPSERVMIKAGFRKEAERIKSMWHDGRLKDRLEYAMNKEDLC